MLRFPTEACDQLDRSHSRIWTQNDKVTLIWSVICLFRVLISWFSEILEFLPDILAKKSQSGLVLCVKFEDSITLLHFSLFAAAIAFTLWRSSIDS